jgi:hypothetical protein
MVCSLGRLNGLTLVYLKAAGACGPQNYLMHLNRTIAVSFSAENYSAAVTTMTEIITQTVE